jgi:hypothetical protein
MFGVEDIQTTHKFFPIQAFFANAMFFMFDYLLLV